MRNLCSILFFTAAMVIAPSLIDAQSEGIKAGAAAQTAPAKPTAADPEVIPADRQASKEELDKLFTVMRIREQFENSMKALPSMLQQQVKVQARQVTANLPEDQKPTAQQQADIDKLTQKYMDKAIHLYPVDEMLSDMSDIYQRYLSRTDVEAFIAFYSSQPGQDLLNMQPVIMKQYMPLVMKRTQERSKALTDEMIKDMTDAIKASPAAAPRAAAPATAPQPK